jgi:hypothetical protein
MMLVALLLASGVAVAATLSNTSDRVPQTNGRVTTIAFSSSTNMIYLGGSFTEVITQAGVAVPRSRLAAINAVTGELTDWAPHVSRPVSALAVSEDGTRIYAGGSFNKAGGKVHNYVAAIEADGDVDHGFDAGADLPVRALATSGSRLYLGGEFGAVNGVARSRLALVNGINGDLDPTWAPAANGPVRALELSGSRLYVGGEFTTISGQTRRNLAALDASPGSTGAVVNWRPRFSRPVYDVEASGTSVYVAGGGVGGEGAAFDASATGAVDPHWSVQGDGDFQAVAYLDGQVYFGGHFRELTSAPYVGTRRVKLLAVDANTGALSEWKPKASGGGVWAVEADAPRTRIYAGGDFTRISGRLQEGFAGFSVLP